MLHDKISNVWRPTLLPSKGEKLVVTDYSLSHWIAQAYNLDINDWPKKKPEHFQKETYEQLKRLFRPYINPLKPAPGE
jgi:hypothetical protein